MFEIISETMNHRNFLEHRLSKSVVVANQVSVGNCFMIQPINVALTDSLADLCHYRMHVRLQSLVRSRETKKLFQECYQTGTRFYIMSL